MILRLISQKTTKATGSVSSTSSRVSSSVLPLLWLTLKIMLPLRSWYSPNTCKRGPPSPPRRPNYAGTYAYTYSSPEGTERTPNAPPEGLATLTLLRPAGTGWGFALLRDSGASVGSSSSGSSWVGRDLLGLMGRASFWSLNLTVLMAMGRGLGLGSRPCVFLNSCTMSRQEERLRSGSQVLSVMEQPFHLIWNSWPLGPDRTAKIFSTSYSLMIGANGVTAPSLAFYSF